MFTLFQVSIYLSIPVTRYCLQSATQYVPSTIWNTFMTASTHNIAAQNSNTDILAAQRVDNHFFEVKV